MALYPQFRAIGHAQRSVQSNPITEPDILSPAAGAPHSAPFQVATITGLAGYQPYLKIPPGRRGGFDPLTCKGEHGTLTLWFIDPRLSAGGSQALRWLSAFTGAADGRPQMLGCKFRVQWRTDPAAAWTDYWTGRVKRHLTRGLLLIGVELGDMSEALDAEIGLQRPSSSATGVVTRSLLPQAVTGAYGTLVPYNGKGRLTGTVKTSVVQRYIELDAASRGRADNVVNVRLFARASQSPSSQGVIPGRFASGLRLRFSSSSPSLTNKEVAPVGISWSGSNGPARVHAINVTAVDPADPFYTAFDSGAVPDGTVVSFEVVETEQPVTLVQAKYIRHLADILDGCFFPLSAAGAVTRRTGRESSSFTALLANPADPTGRFPVQRAKANLYIEENLLQPGQYGLRFNESGEAVVYSTALPTSLAGLPVITDADLLSPRIDWAAEAEGTITELVVQGYEEAPNLPESLLAEWPADSTFLELGGQHAVNFTPRRHTIRALGLRSMPGEITAGISRYDWVRAEQIRIAEALKPTFGLGRQPLGFRVRRNATTMALYGGMFALLDVSYGPPNAATNQRGGPRLIRITGRNEDGLALEFDAIDVGPGVLATAPTIGTPAKEAGNGQYGFTAAITLSGTDPAIVWVCYTATSVGTRPADTDPGWHMVFPIANTGTIDVRITTSATHTFRLNPPGMRAWVRIQTVIAYAGGGAKLPSVFAYPSGTGYVDLDALAACTGAAISAATAKAALFAWTVGDAALPLIILLGSGASQAAADASTPVAVSPALPPGSTFFHLSGLDLGGPWYRAQVAHLDAWGKPGPVAGTTPTSFQATGTAVTAPTPAALVVSRQGSTGSPASTGGPRLLFVFLGNELILVPGPTGLGYDAKIHRAPESSPGSGTPGAFVHIDTIEAEILQGRSHLWRDPLPNDGRPRFYKFLLGGVGVLDGAYSPIVSAIPGWLTPMAFSSLPGETVLGQTEVLRIPSSAFVPDIDTATYAQLAAYLQPRLSGAGNALTAYAPVILPDGVTITAIRTRGYRNGASDVVDIGLSYAVDGTNTAVATANMNTTGGWNERVTTGLAHTVAASRAYYLSTLLSGNTAAADARLAYVEISFVRNSERQ